MYLQFAFRDWIYSLTIGILVVSYWRHSWTLLDILGCHQPSTATLANGDTFCFALLASSDSDSEEGRIRLRNATVSYVAGTLLLFVGVSLVQCGYWLPDRKTMIITPQVGVCRFVIVYIVGAAAVNVWRGIWYWMDAWILPTHPFASYVVTSVLGAGAAFCTGTGSSLLAPPAMFLLDGPDTDPPPIAVTVLNAHFSVTLPCGKERPHFSKCVTVLDILFSFIFVPFAVVSFWRGSWLLLDYFFWGFTDSSQEVRLSLLWSMCMFILCIWLTSEPVVGMIDRQLRDDKFLLGLLGRTRNYILAWGTVSFWRCFWLSWDEFLGESTIVAASVGHVLSLVGLLAMGCMASINAPPSTIGVDSVPNPGCEDDPLFSLVPLPWETLYAFGMFRQIDKTQEAFQPHRINAVANDERRTSTGEIELTVGHVDHSVGVPLAGVPVQESSLVAGMTTPPSLLRRIRSWRPGPVRMEGRYGANFLVQPSLRVSVATNYLQRPGDDNIRSRSRFFKNRGNGKGD